MVSGALWHLARWTAAFGVSYLAYESSGSAAVSQVAAGLSFLPMLAGSVAIGPWSDRTGSFFATQAGLGVCVAAAASLTVTVLIGQFGLLPLLAASLAFGFCNTLDLTGRKSLLAQQSTISGQPLLTVETVSMAACQAVGPALGGLLLAGANAAVVFGVVAALAVSALLLLRASLGEAASGASRLNEAASAVRVTKQRVARPARLPIILGVTVLMNIGYYSHVSLIPAFATKFSDSPTLAGFLGAASGLGMAAGAIALLSWLRHAESWWVYLFGSAFALVSLAVATIAPSPALAMLCLAVAGTGLSGFVTMQTVLVAQSANPEAIGQAMGRMSTAIGVLPLAMIMLGAVSDLTTPSRAIQMASLASFTCLACVGWLVHAREPATSNF
jgi:predicted MFS family arabinose efflux permease